MNYYEQLQQGHYGSMELKNHQSQYLLTGLMISFLIHSTLIGIPYMLGLLTNTGLNADQGGITIIIPPPGHPQIHVERPVIEPTVPTTSKDFGKPIPVVDDPPSVEAKDPIRQSNGNTNPFSNDGKGDELSNGNSPLTGNILPDPIPGSDVFIPFEIEPKPLPNFSPQPAFPALAQVTGIAGKVKVKVFVDKFGEVKKYEIVQAKPSGFGFEEEVAKVITKWKFTPAIQQGNPVGVWISIPFNFKYKK